MKVSKVILPDETSSTELCCLGHSEALIRGHSGRGDEEDDDVVAHDPASIIRIPNSASLQHKMTLTIRDFALNVPYLTTLESKLRLHMAKLYNVDNDRTIIRNRRVMVGLHNGHTVVNSELVSVPMVALEDGRTNGPVASADADSKSASNEDINLADYSVLKVSNKKMASNIVLNAYSNHELMALVFVLQVDVVTPSGGDETSSASGTTAKNAKKDSRSLALSASGSGSDTVTTAVTLGVGAYFPWNGRTVHMDQTIVDTSEGTDAVSTAMNKDVQVALTTEDSLCRVLTTSPIFQLPNDSRHAPVATAVSPPVAVGAKKTGRGKDSKNAAGDDAKAVRFSTEQDSKAAAGHSHRHKRNHEQNDDTYIFCCFGVELRDCNDKEVNHGDSLKNGKKVRGGASKSKSRARAGSGSDDGSDGKGSGDEKPDADAVKPKTDKESGGESSEEEEESDRRKRKGKGKKSRSDYFKESDVSADEDRFSDRFSDSLVMGTTDYSGIRLNPDLYGNDVIDRDYTRPDEDVSFGRSRSLFQERSGRFDVTSERRAHEDSRAHLRSSRDANSILYKSLNSKLVGDGRADIAPEPQVAGMSHAARRSVDPATAAVAASVPLYTHCSASTFVRELSRSARSALTRFGYGDVLSEARYPDSRDRYGGNKNMKPPLANSKPTEGNSIDIGVELRDPLAGNEIQIQFAGYSSAQPPSSSGYGYTVPKNVYCSYQFYTCLASRTEIMKLVPYSGAGGGHTKGSNTTTSAVFVRAAGDVREEIPLCMNYDIDMTFPQERCEFIDYCSKHNLFVDVWDANSMLLIGQCLVPLKRLLRQGADQVKFALECDIISTSVGSGGDAFDPSKNALTAVSADTATAVPCCIIPHNQGPVFGEVVGSLQVIVSNIGHKSHRVAPITNGFPGATGNTPSANWRAMEAGDQHGYGSQSQPASRPRNIVRARPLTDASPQLSKILDDYRHNSGASMRSLAANRDKTGDNGGLYTLNYDEISMLFRRFQGKSKGTVVYAGPMLNLIDTPSWAVVLKKLITVHNKAMNMNFDMAEGMRAYGDAKSNITKVGLKEYLSVLFERLGIPVKPEELSVLAHHLVGFTTSTMGDPVNSQSSYVSIMLAEQDQKPPSVSHVTANTPTTITKVVEYCNDQAVRLNWVSSSKKFRRLIEKTNILKSAGAVNNINASDDTNGGGVTEYAELHERLSDVDSDGDSMITGKELYTVLHDYLDGSLAANSGNKQENTDHLMSTIELKRIVEQFVIKKRKTEEQKTHTRGVDVKLMEGDGTGSSNSNKSEISTGSVSLVEFMSFLGSSYVGNISSRLKGILSAKAKTLPGGNSSPLDAVKEYAEQVLSKLDMPRQQSDVATSNSDGSSSSAEDAAYLAKVMSNKKLSGVIENLQSLCQAADHAEGGGLTLEQIFKVLDKSKDGNLSVKELTVGLQKYPQFKHVTDADFKVLFNTLFDRNHDGDVSFPEFRDVVKNYNPQTGCFSEASSLALKPQARAKPHVQAAQAKISLSTKLSYDAVEVCLRQFGVYDVVSHEQVMRLLVKIANLDANKSKSSDPSAILSLAQLFQYLGLDVFGNTRAVNKTCSDVITSLQDLCKVATTSTDGLSLEQIFKVLDKSKDGNLSVKELTVGLQKYPQFKHVTDAYFKVLFNTLFDRNHDGDVSFPEFKSVIENYDVATGCFSATALGDVSGPPSGGYNSAHPKTKDFIGTLRALAETEGGIVSLCSYLDKDEDGVVWWDDLVRYLRREQVIVEILSGHGSRGQESDVSGPVTYTEQELADVLAPICIKRQGQVDRDDRESKGVLVTGMLHIVEQGKVSASVAATRHVKPHKKSKRHRGEESKGGDSDSDSDGDSAIDDGYVAKQYEFSSIIEVEQIEKKIRQVGRLLAAKGVDIASLFVKFDPYRSGSIRNTEFMEILTSMGMYILEHNRAANDEDESKVGDDDHRRHRGDVHIGSQTQARQVQQISNLRKNYENSAPQAARRLISEAERVDARRSGGKDSYKGRSDFREHLESMALVNMYRQSQKKQMLQRVLSHSLAHSIDLYPRFGKTLFFEYPITNPFAHEERFCIEVHDSELRVVTDLAEWQHLRDNVRPCIGDLNPVNPVETEIFDVHVSPSGTTQIQLLLLPQETFYIPFTLLTLIPYQKSTGDSALQRRGRKQAATSRRSVDRYRDEESKFDADPLSDEEGADESTMQRSIEIKFISGSHGHVVSILNCNVFPRPFIVNRVMRHYEAGNSILKRQIQLLGYDDPSTVHSNSSGADHKHMPKSRSGSGKLSKFVHCVENGFTSRVVVEWNQASNGSDADDGYVCNSNTLLNIVFRYRCDGYPSVGSFYLLVYNDQFQSSLYEIWEVVVQTCQKIDLIGNIGNINTFDLVVRGDDAKVPVQYPTHQQHLRSNTGNRRCKAYYGSTPTDRMVFQPASVFQLVSGAYNKITAQYTCTKLGRR